MSAYSIPPRPLKGRQWVPKSFKGIVYPILLISHPCTTLCAVAFQAGTGQLIHCKQRYACSRRRLMCTPIIPSMPHSSIFHEPLNLGTLPQQIQCGITLPPLGTSGHPYVGQPQNIYPLPATSIPLNNWQQSTSLPQNSLGPHPQSLEWTDLERSLPFPCASTSSGPPPKAASASHHLETVDMPKLHLPPK